MDTSDTRESRDLEERFSEEYEQRPSLKRARVALACQRCRARKQKCDGAQDSCSTCTRLGLRCSYKAHLAPKPNQNKLYINALEDRVAELETFLSGLGYDSVGDDHWKQKQYQLQDARQAQDDPPTEETDTLISAVRELVSSASTHYVKGTSTVTLGRVLGSVINSQRAPETELDIEVENKPRSISSSELSETMGPMFVTPAVATRLLDGWMKHFSTRYPVIHSHRLREIHSRRNDTLDFFEESILHLVYANSGRFLETTGETGNFCSDEHYEAALQHMDSVLQLHDTRSITYLLLMALYCLRVPKDPGAWTLAGLAVRLCIELGLHRRSSNKKVSIERELEKRIFWSCYYLDREVSMALARPPAISDNDMDVEFPIDIDEDMDDLEALKQAAQNNSDYPASPASSLTPFIHFMRLRKIESKIEHVVYRVDTQTPTTPQIIQEFLDQLSAWKRAIPPEYHDRQDTVYEPFNGIDIFMILYFKCVRLLLYPQLSRSPLNLQYLKICAEACAGVCESYKRLHRTLKADYSPMSFQSVFLAGLTLIYCTWLAPRNFLDVSGPISDCNIMLYVMTERWPVARKYRDVFERIKASVTDVIAKGNHQATRAAGILNEDMTERCRALDQGLPGGARTDYSQMINSMARRAEKKGSDTRRGTLGAQAKGQNRSKDNEQTSRFGMWPAMLDYGRGNGQLSNFTDAVFMDNLDYGGLTTDWDLSMLDSTNNFNI